MEQPTAAINVQLLWMVGRKEGLEEEHKREAMGICPVGWLYQRPRRQARAREPCHCCNQSRKWVEVQRHHQGLISRINFQIPYLLLL